MATSSTLLLTGFEPYDTWKVNPSWEIARSLDGKETCGLKVVSRRLPVNWQSAWPALQEAISETHPSWVLMLGQAPKRPHISVESCGRNVCGDKLDNTGQSYGGSAIQAGGADLLACTLPVDDIVESIRALGIPVERSDSAGSYLCNYTLYSALSWAKNEVEVPAIGFIHIPAISGSSPEYEGMPLGKMIRAIQTAIEAIANAKRKAA
jgi:pyroglutamyl-peptidase